MLILSLILLLTLLVISDSFYSSLNRPRILTRIYEKKKTEKKHVFVPISDIIKRCRSSKDWNEGIEAAEKLLEDGGGVGGVNSRLVTGIIRIFGESGNLGRAITMLYEMKQVNIIPNEHHFGALLQSCRSVGQWEIALELFSQMDEIGVKRNTIHYNILISTLGDAKRADLVLTMLNQMHKEHIRFDAVTFSAAITACARNNLWKEALKLWGAARKMDKNSVNVITFNSLLSACSSGRKFDIVLMLLEEVRKDKSVILDKISFSLVISACGEIGNIDKAEYYFQMMNDYQIERDVGVYNAYITACERTQNWELSIELLNRMNTIDNLKPDARSYSAAISCCGSSGRWKDSLSLFHRMDREGIVKDTVVYNAIISALQKGDQWNAAKDVQDLLSSSLDSSSLSSIDMNKVLSLSSSLSNAGKETIIRDQATDVVYSQGVRDGQLRHWGRDDEPSSSYMIYNSTSSTSIDARTMDLHGFPLPVAKAAVDFVLDEMKSTGELYELIIITGRGNHINNSGTKRVLREHLVSHILAMKPLEILEVEVVQGNDGCIKIPKDSINQWIETINTSNTKSNDANNNENNNYGDKESYNQSTIFSDTVSNDE